ncbi:hypothetical protein H6G33_32410 [Calothrix sp. FACHB-1219]|uniref:hypothetical protein n=1 Tax=unclassified Calothrix TaxID=2619626 RepID=UPI00168457EF|nr:MULTISPECIES: hypothetical protein [unclassified Calothrix]MBD2207056.1 hypothetical protein [Calothrix sp. FACHB-168]MBD2221672.1 hypothetical protein [Calothrix sp. FACHB-1219]
MTNDSPSQLSLNAPRYLVNRIPLIGLGVKKPLGQKYSLLARKESSSVPGQSSAIKPIGNHLPLVTASQFLLSPENPTFSEPIIDNHDAAEPDYINTGVTFIDFDNADINEEVSNSLDSQNIDNNPLDLNHQAQSNSKKSQKSSSKQEKSKAKPKTTKKAKSSVKDKGNKQDQQINLSAVDDAASTAINLENNQAPKFTDNNNDRDTASTIPNTIFLDSPLGENLISEETSGFTDAAASNVNFHDENISDNLTRSPEHTTSQTPINQGFQTPTTENNIENAVKNTVSSDINIRQIPQQQEADNSAKFIANQAVDREGVVLIERKSNADNIISEQPIVASQAVDLSDISENIIARKSDISSNIPVEFTPTPPVIFNPVEVTEEQTDTEIEKVVIHREFDTDNIIANQPIVASQAVNLNVSENASARQKENPNIPVIADNSVNLDVSENAIARQTENPHLPVELTPTPPVIFNPVEVTQQAINSDNIIPHQPTVASQAVNLDVRENAIAQKSENPNIPVELTPTPPVIFNPVAVTEEAINTDNIIPHQPTVTSQAVNVDVSENAIAQKSENLNIPVIADKLVHLDVRENAIAQKSENPNIPVELTPTPPVIFNPVEVTEEAINTDNIIPHQPTVTSQAVNVDLRENAIARQTENPNIPVDLTPTPPVIFNPVAVTEEAINTDNIIPHQPTVASQSVNLDVSENALARKSENPNIPLELAPTPPVIADKLVHLDVSENAIAQKSENPNIPVELTPTPPVIFNPVEVTEQPTDTDNIIPNQPTVASQPVNVDLRENAIARKSENLNITGELTPIPPVIADNLVNLDVSENAIARQTENPNIPVELTPTPPIIFNPVEVTEEPIDTDNIIPNQPTVASQTVNVDLRENAIARKSENLNIPGELTPIPPVIADNLVNLDVSENAIARKSENPNTPVEFTPTPPVIADNPTFASQTLNLSDAPVSQVSALDNSQVNTDIPTGVTPPIFSENTEVDANIASKFTQFNLTKNQTQNLDNIPAPQGYATGGQVTHSSVEKPHIASSDTVPAMLTPGEFVVNANDAQKNLHILRHINTGGVAEDIILPSLEIPTPENPTKVDSFDDTSLQRHPADLGTEISQQRLSPHNSLQLNHVNRQATAANPPSPHYSLPTLIFRKPSGNDNTAYETPNQWSTVEELLNGSNDPFTFFNLNNEGESNWQNSSDSQSSQSSSTSPQVFTKRLSPQGFANGGEVKAPDIATDIPPVTQTIQNPSVANPEADESANLEALAYEIYNRLRQKIEVERERQGIYLGRLPW